MATVKLVNWAPDKIKAKSREEFARWLNEAGAIGVTRAQVLAPRDTGFMASTIEVVHRATAARLSVVWGNITADYTIWQEIGSQGRPGRYFLRQSLEYASQQLLKKGSAA